MEVFKAYSNEDITQMLKINHLEHWWVNVANTQPYNINYYVHVICAHKRKIISAALPKFYFFILCYNFLKTHVNPTPIFYFFLSISTLVLKAVMNMNLKKYKPVQLQQKYSNFYIFII